MDGRSCPRFSVLWCVPAAPANGIEGGASRAARTHQTAPVGATQVPRSRTCTDVFTEAQQGQVCVRDMRLSNGFPRARSGARSNAPKDRRLTLDLREPCHHICPLSFV